MKIETLKHCIGQEGGSHGLLTVNSHCKFDINIIHLRRLYAFYRHGLYQDSRTHIEYHYYRGTSNTSDHFQGQNSDTTYLFKINRIWTYPSTILQIGNPTQRNIFTIV